MQTAAFAALAVLGSALAGAMLSQADPQLVVLGSIGAIVALLTVQRVEVGLFILVLVTYTRAFDVAEHGLGLPSLTLPFVGVLLVVNALARKPARRSPATSLPLAVLAFGLYGLVLLASAAWAHDPNRTLEGVFAYTKDVLVAVSVVALVTDVRRLRIAVWALIAGAAFLSVITVFQYATQSFTQDYYGFALSPIQNIVGQTDLARSAGPVGDPNFFAQMMLAALPLALERFVHERSLILRIVAVTTGVFVTLTIVFTFSRGAFLGLFCLCLLFVAKNRRLIPALAVTTMLFVAIGFLAVPEEYAARLRSGVKTLVESTGGSSDDPAVQGRLSEATIALMMARDHPLVGVGHDNYPALYQDYNRQLGMDRRSEERSAHSLFLQIAAETGMVGLLAWGLVMFVTFRSLSATRKRGSATVPEESTNLAGGLQLAMYGWLITSLFLHSAYPRIFWLFVGIAVSASQVVPEQEIRTAPRAQQRRQFASDLISVSK